jgi:transmembrane sensor
LTVENTINDIDELIGKHLAGEASSEENAILKLWLEQSQANRKYYDQFKLIFDKAATVKEWQQFDPDAAWNKVRTRLRGKQNGRTVTFLPDTSMNLFWRVAAGIVLALGIGFFTYKVFHPFASEPIEVITGNQSAADTLPDGSGVFLNKETKLAYSFDEKKKIHKVRLQGEAYFNIQHHDGKKFIVEVDDVFIRDIGTSFNVKAYPGSNTIEVVVEEGEIIFYTENDSGISLRAGGKGVYQKDIKKFTIEEAGPNVTAYKTRIFIFNDTDLATIAQMLNSVYDKRIIIGKNLQSCRLTVSFNNESIEEITSVIAETLGLTVNVSDQALVLEGTGCEK